MKKLILALALAALATPANAAEWTVNPAASKLGWQARFNGQPVDGVFKNWRSRIVLDPANLPAASITVQVDVASVESGDAGRDDALRGADFFNAKQFGIATFTSSKITKFGDPNGNRYAAAGTLTLGGITKPLILPFTLTINGTNASAQGELTLSRAAFEVGKGDWKNNSEIQDQVKITYTVNATTK